MSMDGAPKGGDTIGIRSPANAGDCFFWGREVVFDEAEDLGGLAFGGDAVDEALEGLAQLEGVLLEGGDEAAGPGGDLGGGEVGEIGGGGGELLELAEEVGLVELELGEAGEEGGGLATFFDGAGDVGEAALEVG